MQAKETKKKKGTVRPLNMISGNHHSSKFHGKGVYFYCLKLQKKGYSEHPSPQNLKKGYFTELLGSSNLGQSVTWVNQSNSLHPLAYIDSALIVDQGQAVVSQFGRSPSYFSCVDLGRSLMES